MKFNIGIELYFDFDDEILNEYLERNDLTFEEFKTDSVENLREIMISEFVDSNENIILEDIVVKEIE